MSKLLHHPASLGCSRGTMSRHLPPLLLLPASIRPRSKVLFRVIYSYFCYFLSFFQDQLPTNQPPPPPTHPFSYTSNYSFHDDSRATAADTVAFSAVSERRGIYYREGGTAAEPVSCVAAGAVSERRRLFD
jgi:hypothetical protein